MIGLFGNKGSFAGQTRYIMRRVEAGESTSQRAATETDKPHAQDVTSFEDLRE